jgi:hypothetical protein
MNSETGAWEAEGNIFKIPELCKGIVVQEGKLSKEYRMCSGNAKVVGLGVGVDA